MRVNILFFMPNKNYTLENLTWKPNMELWKRIFHFSWVICSFHNFRGCIHLLTSTVDSVDWHLGGVQDPPFCWQKILITWRHYGVRECPEKKHLANYICIWCKGVHTDMIYTDHDVYYLGVAPLRVTLATIITTPFYKRRPQSKPSLATTPTLLSCTCMILHAVVHSFLTTPRKTNKYSLKSGRFKTEMRNDRRPRFFRGQLQASFPFSGGCTVARIFAPSVLVLCVFAMANHRIWHPDDLPSLKLTLRTWKWRLGRRSLPFGPSAHFQGQNGSFGRCKYAWNFRSDSRCNQCIAAGLADSTAEPLYDLYGGKPKMSTKTLPLLISFEHFYWSRIV